MFFPGISIFHSSLPVCFVPDVEGQRFSIISN